MDWLRWAAYKVGLGTRLQVARDVRRRRRIESGRRSGEFLTAMDATLAALRFHGLLPDPLVALEPFGRCGMWKTLDYLPLCRSLDLFDYEPEFARAARRLLPPDTVAVHCEDSVSAVRRRATPRTDYNFVLLDHGCGHVFGDGYCEHYDVLPAVFQVLGSRAVVVANLFRSRRSPGEFDPAYLRRRREFYTCDTDEEALWPGPARLDATYSAAVPSGFRLERLLYVPHPSVAPDDVCFVVLAVERTTAAVCVGPTAVVAGPQGPVR